MSTLANTLQRGTRAAQPLATDVPNGNLYFVTDEGVTEQSNGTAWVSYSGSGGAGTVTHTGALTVNQLVLGNGTADVKPLGALGTTTTVYHGNAAGAGSFGSVVLTTDVSGVLPVVNGGTGSTAGAALLVAPVTIANADVKKLPSTPITLVAAQGSNTQIVPHFVSMRAKFGSGAYTGLDATYAALQIVYTGNTSWIITPIVKDTTTFGITQLTTLMGATDTVWRQPPYMAAPFDLTGATTGIGYIIGADVSTSVANNTDLVIALDNNGSVTDLGGGNAANSLKIWTYYTVESLA